MSVYKFTETGIKYLNKNDIETFTRLWQYVIKNDLQKDVFMINTGGCSFRPLIRGDVIFNRSATTTGWSLVDEHLYKLTKNEILKEFDY